MTYSDLVLNPFGGAETRRTAIQPALGEDLMERVVDSANMRRAWKRVKRNNGAPGIDGMTLEEFPTHARAHWPEIRHSLLDGTYQPSPLRRKIIFLGVEFRLSTEALGPWSGQAGQGLYPRGVSSRRRSGLGEIFRPCSTRRYDVPRRP